MLSTPLKSRDHKTGPVSLQLQDSRVSQTGLYNPIKLPPKWHPLLRKQQPFVGRNKMADLKESIPKTVAVLNHDTDRLRTITWRQTLLCLPSTQIQLFHDTNCDARLTVYTVIWSDLRAECALLGTWLALQGLLLLVAYCMDDSCGRLTRSAGRHKTHRSSSHITPMYSLGESNHGEVQSTRNTESVKESLNRIITKHEFLEEQNSVTAAPVLILKHCLQCKNGLQKC